MIILADWYFKISLTFCPWQEDGFCYLIAASSSTAARDWMDEEASTLIYFCLLL